MQKCNITMLCRESNITMKISLTEVNKNDFNFMMRSVYGHVYTRICFHQTGLYIIC